MFLFIFESIGTSEMILVGIVALIFLGPRRLPEIAKKAGKIMSEFRGTANEFKETWQREVNFEDEAKSLDLRSLEAEAESIARETPAVTDVNDGPETPEVKEIDPAAFEHLAADESVEAEVTEPTTADDKRNWL